MHDPVEECMQQLNEATRRLDEARADFANHLTSDFVVRACEEKVEWLRDRYNTLVIAYGSDE
jgi:hypothetical protein